MGDLDKYLYDIKEMAEDAGDAAKNIAGEVVSSAKKFTGEGGKGRELAKTAKELAGDAADKIKDLTADGSEAREIAKKAKEEAASISKGVSEKVQGVLQGGKAAVEISRGIEQLAALPEVEGSIIYSMELETATNYLNSLKLVISDSRIDSRSAEEEIRAVMEKVQPAADPDEDQTDEQQAIENIRAIAYNACTRALEVLK